MWLVSYSGILPELGYLALAGLGLRDFHLVKISSPFRAWQEMWLVSYSGILPELRYLALSGLSPKERNIKT
jgi:hypothetical protein